MFGILQRFGRSGNDNEIGGPDAIFAAILDHGDQPQRFTVTLGEPTLIERSPGLNNEYRVVIPTYTLPDDPETCALEYQLPEGEDEFLESELAAVLDDFDLSLDGLEEVEGTQVPAELEGGTPTLLISEAY